MRRDRRWVWRCFRNPIHWLRYNRCVPRRLWSMKWEAAADLARTSRWRCTYDSHRRYRSRTVTAVERRLSTPKATTLLCRLSICSRRYVAHFRRVFSIVPRVVIENMLDTAASFMRRVRAARRWPRRSVHRDHAIRARLTSVCFENAYTRRRWSFCLFRTPTSASHRRKYTRSAPLAVPLATTSQS